MWRAARDNSLIETIKVGGLDRKNLNAYAFIILRKVSLPKKSAI